MPLACGILVMGPGIEPVLPALPRVLTTELPGKTTPPPKLKKEKKRCRWRVGKGLSISRLELQGRCFYSRARDAGETCLWKMIRGLEMKEL